MPPCSCACCKQPNPPFQQCIYKGPECPEALLNSPWPVCLVHSLYDHILIFIIITCGHTRGCAYSCTQENMMVFHHEYAESYPSAGMLVPAYHSPQKMRPQTPAINCGLPLENMSFLAGKGRSTFSQNCCLVPTLLLQQSQAPQFFKSLNALRKHNTVTCVRVGEGY